MRSDSLRPRQSLPALRDWGAQSASSCAPGSEAIHQLLALKNFLDTGDNVIEPELLLRVFVYLTGFKLIT